MQGSSHEGIVLSNIFPAFISVKHFVRMANKVFVSACTACCVNWFRGSLRVC